MVRSRSVWRRLGPSEFLGLLLVCMVVVPAWLWWRDVLVGEWQITTGVAEGCVVRSTHYNAADYRPVVTLYYHYSVHGIEHHAAWEGLWPEAGSPNALSRDQLDALKTPGHPLVIYYNPSNPEQSSPHEDGPGNEVAYASAMVVALCLVIWYFVRVYPARVLRR